jgi:hypothetical protein
MKTVVGQTLIDDHTKLDSTIGERNQRAKVGGEADRAG